MPTSKISYFPLASDEEKQFGMSTLSKKSSSRWKDITLAVLLSLNIGLIVAVFYNGSLGPSPGRSDSLSLCSMQGAKDGTNMSRQ